MLLQCFSVQQVVDVYMGPKGLLSASNSVRPSLLIDASTVDPQTCRRLAKRVADCKLSSNSSMYISIGAISNLPGDSFFQNENCKIKVLNAK
jgi:3-hydroxyisobutyrate dehydrogenase